MVGNVACDVNEECRNTMGSFSCECKNGFQLSNKSICEPIPPEVDSNLVLKSVETSEDVADTKKMDEL